MCVNILLTLLLNMQTGINKLVKTFCYETTK
jgi:hypothetical protein